MTLTDWKHKYIALIHDGYRHPDRLISVKRFKDRVEVYLDYNNFQWFCTLTFEDIPKHLSDEAIYQRVVERLTEYYKNKETK